MVSEPSWCQRQSLNSPFYSAARNCLTFWKPVTLYCLHPNIGRSYLPRRSLHLRRYGLGKCLQLPSRHRMENVLCSIAGALTPWHWFCFPVLPSYFPLGIIKYMQQNTYIQVWCHRLLFNMPFLSASFPDRVVKCDIDMLGERLIKISAAQFEFKTKRNKYIIRHGSCT